MEVVWRDLALGGSCPRLVRDIAARHHPVAARPEMLALVALAQRVERAQELVRAATLHRLRSLQARRNRQQHVEMIVIDLACMDHRLSCPPSGEALPGNARSRRRQAPRSEPSVSNTRWYLQPQAVWPPCLYAGMAWLAVVVCGLAGVSPAGGPRSFDTPTMPDLAAEVMPEFFRAR